MPTLTLNDLSNRVYARVDANSLLYPQAEVTTAINEAIQILNLFTGFLQVSANVSGNSVANQTFYTVPTGILIPMRVQFKQTYLPLLNLVEIGQQYPTWTADTTATTGLPVCYWIPFGLTGFAIYPADAIGGNTITVTGVQEPVLLVSSGDVITMTNEMASALDYYAFNILTLKESGKILNDSFSEFKRFQKQISRIKLWQGMSWPSGNAPFSYQPEGAQKGRP